MTGKQAALLIHHHVPMQGSIMKAEAFKDEAGKSVVEPQTMWSFQRIEHKPFCSLISRVSEIWYRLIHSAHADLHVHSHMLS